MNDLCQIEPEISLAFMFTRLCSRVIYAILNASVILERNETRLARNEKHLTRNETRLARNETRLARNETRGGNLPLSGTVYFW